MYLHHVDIIIIFARSYLGKSSCSSFVTPRGAVFSSQHLAKSGPVVPAWLALGFLSLWIQHVWRVSCGISGTSSSAGMLITNGLARGTPSVLWIAPRHDPRPGPHLARVDRRAEHGNPGIHSLASNLSTDLASTYGDPPIQPIGA